MTNPELSQNRESHSPQGPSKRQAALALLLLVPAPSLGVAFGMWMPETRGTPLGQGLYFFSKLWILALPLLWTAFVDRARFSWSPPKGGFAFGLYSGLLIGSAIIAVYLLLGHQLIDVSQVRSAAQANGIAEPWRYIGLATYLSLVNAVLEEYVWRWFVFKKSERLWGAKAAVFASAFFFTPHHIWALKAQFNLTVTALCAVGVFVGGVIWSWSYDRFRSIWPGYLSHALVDIAIMLVGYHLIFG